MEQKNPMVFQVVDTVKQQKDSYDLWKMCFNDTKEYMDNYFAWRLKENQILSLYDNEIMASMLHLNPYPIMISGKEIPSNYIVGVATRPEYRGNGLMRNLLTTALKNMYEEGHGFTFLMPAKDKIYLPFDFRYIYEQHRRKLRIKEEDLPFWLEEMDEVWAAEVHQESYDKATSIRVEKLDDSSTKELRELLIFVNKILASNEDIYTKRDEHYYRRLQGDMKSAGGNVLLIYDDNKIVGCTSYMLEGNYGEVTETIIEKEYTKEIFPLIVKEIAAHWMDCKTKDNTPWGQEELEITFLESEFIREKDLGSFKLKEEKNPIIMGRIVNLKKFMENMTAKEPLSITIKLSDPIIKENHGTWEFHFAEKINDKYYCKTTISHKEPELILDIGTFIEISMGYKKITELNDRNLTKETVEKLENINFFHKLLLNEIV